jgi:sugar lactone lactonase YvrE
MTRALRVCPGSRAVLGEGPVWDTGSARLHWLDADQKKLFRFDPMTEAADAIDLPHSPGCYAFRADGGIIMAYRNQLTLAGDDAGDPRPVPTPGVDFAIERFNDGTTDRAGRFWAGTMDKRLKEPVGHLFRIDPDLSIHEMARGIVCSNGVAFSPDDRTFYHTDTGLARIDAYDFDLERGTLANRRVHIAFGEGEGRPDGCAIDAEGCLWVAAITAGRVVRVDPKGRVIGRIDLPMSRPTSVAFGGPELRTLFITSMRHGLTPEQAAKEPEAGALLAIDLDVPGLPAPRFVG